MENTMLNVLIVGCGNIGGGFDLDYNGDLPPCTHAGSFAENQRFKIVGCVDPDREKSQQFQARWEIDYIFSTIAEVVDSSLAIDVVSICSPTDHHKNDVLNAIKLQPKLIFCEKPITPSVEESRYLISLCESHNILLAVNYHRRWDDKIIQLKQSIIEKEHGELRSIIGVYNKGILNNGSHLLDFLNYLLGELEIVACFSPLNDFFEDDPSISALLRSKHNTPVHLVTAHAKDYSFFECQFVFSSGVLSMQEGGMYWLHRSTKESERFTDYIIVDKGIYKKGALDYSFSHAVDNIYNAVCKDAVLNSDGHSALRVQVLCETLLKKAVR